MAASPLIRRAAAKLQRRVRQQPIAPADDCSEQRTFAATVGSAASGEPVAAQLCLGTAGLMVLRAPGGRRPLRPRSGSARPLRTLAFGAVLRHEQVAVRSSKLTGDHAGALIVDYREAGRASERVFLFMAPPDAEALSGALKAQQHRIATERASQAAEQQRAGSSRAGREHTAAKVALMTAKTKARCGQRMWAQMSAEKRTAAVRVMLQSHAAVPSPALSPRRSIAKKARNLRLTAATSPARSSPTRILEYVHPTHGPAVAF